MIIMTSSRSNVVGVTCSGKINRFWRGRTKVSVEGKVGRGLAALLGITEVNRSQPRIHLRLRCRAYRETAQKFKRSVRNACVLGPSSGMEALHI